MEPRFGLLCAAALMAATAASAQEKVLYVSGNGGSQEELMTRELFPQFEKETGVKVVYSAGNSAAVLAKLLAQKENQQIDVAMMNTGPMSQAIQLGLCQDVDLGDQAGDVYDFAKFASGKAVGFGIVGLGLAYNAETFEKSGWPAPTSWSALEDPKFAGRVVFQPISNTNGLLALIKLAEMNGGGVDDMDPGFEVMADKIAPNVLSFEPASARLAEMFQSNEVDLAVWSTTQVDVLAKSGFPVKLAYPDEGAMVISNDVCPVSTASPKPEAQALIRYLVSPGAQAVMARGLGFGPINRLTELTPAEAEGIPYGPEAIAKLEVVDWDVVNARREDWDRRWVREIER